MLKKPEKSSIEGKLKLRNEPIDKVIKEKKNLRIMESK